MQKPQIGNEDHRSVFTDLKEAVAGLQRSMEAKMGDLQEEISKQGRRVTELTSKMDAFGEDIQRIKDSLPKVEDNDGGERPSTDNEKKDTSTPPSRTAVEEAPVKPPSDGEVAEDVLEFEYEDVYQDIEDGVPEEERNADEEKRMRTETKTSLERQVPRRIIAFVNILRAEETYIRCGFCNEKGQHYSDCCPLYRDVDARERRVWCRNCLDTLHSTDRCWRRRMRCRYCGLDSHHSALCSLPERIERNESEYRDLSAQLAELEDQYGGPSS
ncbi:hypothetical protein COOONC_24859 [Cooperia oncophora]